ncbi:tRNA ligase anticodon binding domain protein, partial [Streptomyces ipomoeae 91-03]
MCERA